MLVWYKNLQKLALLQFDIACKYIHQSISPFFFYLDKRMYWQNKPLIWLLEKWNKIFRNFNMNWWKSSISESTAVIPFGVYQFLRYHPNITQGKRWHFIMFQKALQSSLLVCINSCALIPISFRKRFEKFSDSIFKLHC